MPHPFPRAALALALSLVLPCTAPGQQPLHEFRGCDGPIRTVAFSPDGKTVAAGGAFNDVRLWDASGGKEPQRLKGRAGRQLAVAFSPDGQALASTNWTDGSCSLWDLPAGKERFPLKDHPGREVHHVAFSPDGKQVGSVGARDGTIRVWDVRTGKLVRAMNGHRGGGMVLAFSPDSKRLATGGGDGVVKLWDATNGAAIRTYPAPGGIVTGLAFSPDGARLYGGSHDGLVREWDVDGGKELRRWSTGRGAARTLALSPDGRSLAVSNEQGSAQVWELATLRQRRFFATDSGFTWAVAFAPDGKAIATGGDDRVVRLWDLTDGWAAEAGRRPLREKDLERLWEDLAGADAARAYTAVWALAARPEESVPFLAPRLLADRPEMDPKRIALLIRRLDDDSFDARVEATRELAGAGLAAKGQLAEALTDCESPEQRRRIEWLLGEIGDATLAPEQLRTLRGTEALERIDAAEARRVLEQLAKARGR